MGDELRIPRTIPALVTLAMSVACDSATEWPPHQDELELLLDQQKNTFVVIEEEMEADGLIRMGPAIYADSTRSLVMPKLPSSQTEKYVALFESTQIYLDVTRGEEATAFELLLQNVGPRLYLSRFVHRTTDDELPTCAPAMRRAACGTCSIRLESDWLLEYSWFPADPEVEAEKC